MKLILWCCATFITTMALLIVPRNVLEEVPFALLFGWVFMKTSEEAMELM